MAESPEPSSSLECIVCSDSFRKLKRLTCNHAFCSRDHSFITCLETIKQGHRVRCPFCRQETELTPFGIGDLPGQFGGVLECTECSENIEMVASKWCGDCKSVLCSGCVTRNHKDHATETANKLGPVKFCVQQLDKFSAIHTKLTLIQKQLIKEYLQQLGECLERRLDDELSVRLRRLKAEKRHLQGVFDINNVPSATPPSVPPTSAAHSSRFAYALNEVYKMSPTSLKERTELGVLPKEGLIFNPLPLEDTVDMFLKQDKFATFACSVSTLFKIGASRVPSMYIGAGQLDDPCDLCAIPDKDLLVVTCIFKGLFCFKISTAELLRLYLVTVLRHYCDWYIQMYDQRLQLRQEIPCPKDPRVNNSWYRWLTPLRNGRVLMSYGDKRISSIWLLDLNANRWKQLVVKTDSTFRRAAFNPARSGAGGLIYVPDMQRRNIVTYMLSTDTWELTDEKQISTDEFTQELPVCVDTSQGMSRGLIVGNWYSGNIIVADLHKCSSHVITTVGPKELFSFHAVNDKLAVLCKQKEVVEVYNLTTNN